MFRRHVFVALGALALLFSMGSPAQARVQVHIPNKYLGAWSQHSGPVYVEADGVIVIDFRIYRFCGPSVRYGCDKIIGSTLYSGGAAIAKTQRVGATRLFAVVDNAANSAWLGKQLRMRVLRNHTARVTIGSTSFTICKPGAPVGACGA